MPLYRVVRCPNCAHFQVTGASKSLKCLKCNKSKVISYLKIYFKSYDPKECQIILSKLKEEEFNQKNKYSDDFESVI